MNEKWYQHSFRRCLVDMHIPDWEPVFFSEFDSRAYIRAMQTAGIDTAYFYADSCVGICNWATRIGHQHNGLRGRDIVKELTEGFRDAGINTVAYINIWSKWVCETYPEWKCLNQEGKDSLENLWNQPGRYGLPCLNSPYNEYVCGLVRELCENYEFSGLWVDMLLWRTVCYCPNCRKRFLEETGHELPEKVNWDDPVWHLFLQKREEWSERFYREIIDTVHRYKPDATVTCNSSYYPNFLYGQSLNFYRMSDFIGGDFEMDRVRHSFNGKLFNSVSKNRPFEFLGSVMDPALNEHSILKTPERMRTLLYSTLLNNGRYGFIDAIDPTGRLDERVYLRMKEILREEQPYEQYLEPEVDFYQDVGLYTSLGAMIDPRQNGARAMDVEYEQPPHMSSVLQAAQALIEHHIPFGVVTAFDLGQLDKYRVLLLPDVYVLTDREVAAFTEFVEKGGCLYVSGRTGLYGPGGVKEPTGRLAALTGVRYTGETEDEITYLRPTSLGTRYLPDYTRKPLTVNTSQMLTEPTAETEVLAMLTLPMVSSKDRHRFASAISDPPGRDTDSPALTRHSYGKGKVIYSASRLELMQKPDQVRLFVSLIRELSGPLSFETDAPACVELSMYRQPKSGRIILNVLNVQKDLPNLPIYDINIHIRPGKRPKRLVSLPERNGVGFFAQGEEIGFRISKLETFAMYALE